MVATRSRSTGQILSTGLHLVGELWRNHCQVDQSAGRTYHFDHLFVRGGGNVFAVDGQQEVTWTQSGHVGHSTRIHIIKVLERREAL